MRKIIGSKKMLSIFIVVAIASILWIPLIVSAVNGDVSKFNYYVKALEYGLKGLIEYFKFVIDLFKAAVA